MEKIRVGILTFLNANNYGASLQAYALYNKLKDIGFEAELVDYRCPAIEAKHSDAISSQKGIKKKVARAIYNIIFSKRRSRFDLFRSRIKKSNRYTANNIGQADAEYDLFITGSDQVFNFSLTGRDKTYYLDFVSLSNKKIAYAASMGNFIDEEKETYNHLLKDFRFLSVREKSTAWQIENELGISCSVVPDPVFLYSAEQWKELLNLNTNIQTSPYVLIYTLFESAELYQLAKEHAKKNNCRIIAITKALRPGGYADIFVRDAGPKEFLTLIMNSAYVVTDSFHGMAFCIIFGKQLKIVMPPKAQNRIIDLFQELDIPQDFECIDYSVVSSKVLVYRERGIAFLEQVKNCKDC